VGRSLIGLEDRIGSYYSGSCCSRSHYKRSSSSMFCVCRTFRVSFKEFSEAGFEAAAGGLGSKRHLMTENEHEDHRFAMSLRYRT
jgi:hypothetical protein